MPIQEQEDKESNQTKQFEPIIMEEVYFNEIELEKLKLSTSLKQQTSKLLNHTPK